MSPRSRVFQIVALALILLLIAVPLTRLLFDLPRQNPVPSPPPIPVAATLPISDSILGSWEALGGDFMGQPMPSNEIGMYITFSNDNARWTFLRDNSWQSYDGYCRIDPDGHPGWLDLGQPQATDPARIGFALYQVSNNTLAISMGKPRPADLHESSLTKLRFRRVASPPPSQFNPTPPRPTK